jgi:hypothetical protein
MHLPHALGRPGYKTYPPNHLLILYCFHFFCIKQMAMLPAFYGLMDGYGIYFGKAGAKI